jgi:hypothetical protein
LRTQSRNTEEGRKNRLFWSPERLPLRQRAASCGSGLSKDSVRPSITFPKRRDYGQPKATRSFATTRTPARSVASRRPAEYVAVGTTVTPVVRAAAMKARTIFEGIRSRRSRFRSSSGRDRVAVPTLGARVAGAESSKPQLGGMRAGDFVKPLERALAIPLGLRRLSPRHLDHR